MKEPCAAKIYRALSRLFSFLPLLAFALALVHTHAPTDKLTLPQHNLREPDCYHVPPMNQTQSFRLPGKTDVENIPCDHINGNSVIYWDDIKHFFPGVKHIRNGGDFVKLLRDSNRNRYTDGHDGLGFSYVVR